MSPFSWFRPHASRPPAPPQRSLPPAAPPPVRPHPPHGPLLLWPFRDASRDCPTGLRLPVRPEQTPAHVGRLARTAGCPGDYCPRMLPRPTAILVRQGCRLRPPNGAETACSALAAPRERRPHAPGSPPLLPGRRNTAAGRAPQPQPASGCGTEPTAVRVLHHR